jgi:hypothetical protein
MKLSQLFEDRPILFSAAQKTVISTPVAAYIRDNNIKQEDIDKAYADIQKTSEFKKLISFGYTLNSSAIQKKRGTLSFKFKEPYGSEDGVHQPFVTCLITSQVREQKTIFDYFSKKPVEGNFDNKRIPSNVRPLQLSNKVPVSETIFGNLKIALQTAIGIQERRKSKISSEKSNKEKFALANGLANGQEVFISGLTTVNPLKKLDDGTFYLNVSKAINGNPLCFDYKNESNFDKSLVFSGAKFNSNSDFRIQIVGNADIKSFDFLPSLIDQARKENLKKSILGLNFESPNVKFSFKNLAKTLKSKNFKFESITFYNYKRGLEDLPLLSLNQIIKNGRFLLDSYAGMLTRKIAEKKVVLNGEKQFDPKEFVSNFENFINGDIDVIDFQNYLLDVGLDKCASF